MLEREDHLFHFKEESMSLWVLTTIEFSKQTKPLDALPKDILSNISIEFALLY